MSVLLRFVPGLGAFAAVALLASAPARAAEADAALTPVPMPIPDALPADVRAVIEAAIASNDANAVATVVRFASQAHPAAASEIAALHDAFRTETAARAASEAASRREMLASASMLHHWDGNIEVGASRSTGSNDSIGFYGAFNAERNGAGWRHRFNARAEIQETNGNRTAERVFAAWQPRRMFDGRLYAFGLAQYERDPFVGFDNRYTAAVGAGYSLLEGSDMRLEVEGGPAFRRTDARRIEDFSAIAGRASIDFTWKINPRLEFKQNGSIFIEAENGSGRTHTALDATVLGPLRVRLSYEMRFERDILREVRSLDTTSRATLVYGF